MNKSVLVLGDVNVDLVIRLENRPLDVIDQGKPGITLFGGGTAANTAVALARLGELVGFVGTVGDDGYGCWALEDLQSEGVDIRDTRVIPDVFTSLIVALIQPGGDRSIYVWPDKGGAHTRLCAKDISTNTVSPYSWLHTTGMCLREMPVRDAQLKAMKLASQAGLMVSLDLNLRLESWGLDQSLKNAFEEAISYSRVVFGNGIEEIMPFTGEPSIEAGSQALSGGKRIVIARKGPEGALVVAPGENFIVPAFPVDVVDTLGAGDAFNGGFICARLAEKDLHESVRWGNAAAALKIGKPGARGLPSREDLSRMLS